MRKIIVHQFISLDGVIQAPGGKDEDLDGGFAYGSWTIPFWHDDIGQHFSVLMDQSDTLLLGRKTWQMHGEAFEKMPDGNEFGDAMKKFKKVVVSTTLKNADLWRNSTIISIDVVAQVKDLKNQEGKNILLDGSSVLVHELIANDLVDEFHLHVYPLVLGNGKKLFLDNKHLKLKLISSQPVPSGVVYSQYILEK
jgi:dihydrofolate reductase